MVFGQQKWARRQQHRQSAAAASLRCCVASLGLCLHTNPLNSVVHRLYSCLPLLFCRSRVTAVCGSDGRDQNPLVHAVKATAPAWTPPCTDFLFGTTGSSIELHTRTTQVPPHTRVHYTPSSPTSTAARASPIHASAQLRETTHAVHTRNEPRDAAPRNLKGPLTALHMSSRLSRAACCRAPPTPRASETRPHCSVG